MKRCVEKYEKQVVRGKEKTCPLCRPNGYQKDRRGKKRRNKASLYNDHCIMIIVYMMQ